MPGEITDLLHAHHSGDATALSRAIALVYDRLLGIAARERWSGRLGGEASSLAHATLERILVEPQPRWNDSRHFLNLFTRTMRRVLVDAVRHRVAHKRGGGSIHVAVDELSLGDGHDLETVIEVHDALDRMARFNPRMADVVECRVFGGLTEEETSASLELPLRTVQRDWQRGRAWLKLALS